jgi:hypothetical protein
MSTSKPKPAAHNSPADTSEAVDQFMAALRHPFKAEIQALRLIITAADPSISEGSNGMPLAIAPQSTSRPQIFELSQVSASSCTSGQKPVSFRLVASRLMIQLDC